MVGLVSPVSVVSARVYSVVSASAVVSAAFVVSVFDPPQAARLIIRTAAVAQIMVFMVFLIAILLFSLNLRSHYNAEKEW